jgi:hypothetical protein
MQKKLYLNHLCKIGLILPIMSKVGGPLLCSAKHYSAISGNNKSEADWCFDPISH